ncbi:MAG TPA: hypothetical protein DCE23_01420, partial [Firmicutes bacterium]|nr:hypothetical protein [Bacillota bacterium]
MKKKVFSYLIAVFSLLAILLSCDIVYAERYSIQDLKQMYPTGMQWNDSYNGGRECAGFAMLIYAKIYGVDGPQNSEVIYDVEQVEPGDIVRYNGHSVFVLSRNGENVTVVECNYDWNNHVRWDQPKTMSELRNQFSFVIKGMYRLGTEPNPTSPTNAKIDTTQGVKVSWNRSYYNYGYKLFIYNENNELVKEQLVSKPTTTTANIYKLTTGNYTVKVYAIGRDDILSSNYTSASFYAEKEAELIYSPSSTKIVGVGETRKIYYNVSDGLARIGLDGAKGSDEFLSYDSDNMTITGLKPGKTTVFFEFETSETKRTYPITVEVVDEIKIVDKNISINEGSTYKLNFTESSTGESISFYSRDKNVVTVDDNGNITAVGPGTTTIRASQTVYYSDRSDYTILSAECEVTVLRTIPDDHRISLNYNNYQINYEDIGITLKDDILLGNEIQWASSNDKIATVDSNGFVVAKAGGFATITARTSKYGSASCLIYVRLLRQMSDGSWAYPGDLNRDGVINSTDGAVISEWYNRNLTEDEIAIADIDGNGVVNSTDEAALMDLYNQNISFRPGSYRPITKVTLSETDVTLDEGKSIILTATITPENTTDSKKITWSSSNTKAVVVDSNGKVTAVGAGSAYIYATNSRGRVYRCHVTVVGNKKGLLYNSSTKEWEYYVDGKPDYTYYGFATNSNGTYYIDKGVVTFKRTGLMYYNKKWVAVINSKVDNSYTGILSNSNGTYLVENGTISFKYNGTYKDKNGNIYMINNSKVNTNVSGLKYVNKTWYYFKKGKTDL